MAHVQQPDHLTLLSMRLNPWPVWGAIAKKNKTLPLLRTFLNSSDYIMHWSSLGVVLKKDGSYRIIWDLSSPRGNAINKGICEEEFSVWYSTSDDALNLVSGLMPTDFLAALNIKHAFQLRPVKPAQWGFIGYCRRGYYFVDTHLPFGSCLLPFLFNFFADLLCWVFLDVLAILFFASLLKQFVYLLEVCSRSQ